MSRTVKIVLIAGGVLVLAMGTCVGGAAWWISSAKEGIVAMVDRVQTEAEAFGTQTDQQGCLDESVARNVACAGLICSAEVSIFLGLCLDVAQSTEGFCDDVPPMSEIMTSIRWRLDTCSRLAGSSEQRCTRLLAEWQRHCDRT